MPPKRPPPPGGVARPGPSGSEGAMFGNSLTANFTSWEADGDTADESSASASTVDMTVAERLAANDPGFVRYLRRVQDSDKMYYTTRREFLDEARGLSSGRVSAQNTIDLVDNLRSELVATGSEAVAESIVPPAFEVEGRILVRWTHSRWPELVAREYISKKRRYGGARQAGPRAVLPYLGLAATVVLLLFVAWPMWTILIDVDAGPLYQTLEVPSTASSAEIKKAYRTLTRKWHPDQNPTCGEPCKAKMRELQHAYDVLLSKGDRKTSSEMARKTQEALEQILAFVFYRGYGMAFAFATFLNYFVYVPRGLVSSRSARVELDGWLTFGVKVVSIAVFSAFTIVFVTGPNMVMLLMSGYRVVMQFKEDRVAENHVRGVFDDEEGESRTAGGRDLVKATTLGNFDLRENAVLFVLPSVAAHLLWEWTHTATAGDPDAPSGMPIFSLGKYTLHLIFGTMYVCAHLINMPPNLFDNTRMMEFTVPNTYFAARRDHVTGRVTRSVTFWSFFTSELTLLVDDIYAFVTHIPAPYRIAVFVCHSMMLLQMFTMPWAQPVEVATTRSVRVHKKLLARKAEAASAAGTVPTAAERYAASVTKLFTLVGRSSRARSQPRLEDAADEPGDSQDAPTADGARAERRDTQGAAFPKTTAKEMSRYQGLDADTVTWESLQRDVSEFRGLRGSGLARLNGVKGLLALAPMGSASGRLVDVVGTVALLLLASVAVLVSVPSETAEAIRQSNTFTLRSAGIKRSGYEAQAGIEGGGVPAPAAIVSAPVASKTAKDVTLGMAGLSAWLVAPSNGDRLQRSIAMNAFAGKGPAHSKPSGAKAKQQKKGGKRRS